MKPRQFLTRAFACLLFVSAVVQADTRLLEKINSDLACGHIVVVYQMLNADSASEQYADWAYYLNEFADSNSPLFKFYSADKILNERLSEKNLDINDSYTLFLKSDAPSYFYQGVVVENLVYLAVKAHYEREEILPVHRAFIPDQVTITLD